MTHPAPDRAARWVHRDAKRVIARAEQSNGQTITCDELRYLRLQVLVLLEGPLPIADPDLETKVRGLLIALDRTLLDVRQDGDAA